MILEQRPNYLVLHNLSEEDRSVEIFGDLASALKRWRSGTRVSPIWAIREYGRYNSEPDQLSGPSTLLFLGPVQPARLSAEIRVLSDPTRVRLWVSMGCFNSVVRIFDAETVNEVLSWAKMNAIPFEAWDIVNGQIGNVRHAALQADDLEATLIGLATLGAVSTEPAMRATLQENLTVTAAALARAAAIYPPAYEEFKKTAAVTQALVNSWRQGELRTLELQFRLVTANAAISRFSSQAFSGIPPILGTECHFWIHSLLGTGSANIALSRLVGWVQKLLGDADLPQRVAQLEQDTNGIPDLAGLTSNPVYLDRDPLAGVAPTPDGPSVPLITYFSGRDGFSSHLQTLSAPLTAIAECNSYRSNLLTVTHEISHILVQVLLTHIYPDLDQPEDLALAVTIAGNRFRATNWLMAARQLLLEAIIGMEQADSSSEISVEELPEVLPPMLRRWRREAQEIIVHTLDFWYFYRGEPEFYVKSIWHSWCTIPGIEERVSEYLMRTLCAVSVTLLREPTENRFPAALRDLKKILGNLQGQGDVLSDYITIALGYIDQAENDEEFRRDLERQYSTRLLLVRLVAIFLASDRLSARLYSDPHMGRGSGYEGKEAHNYDQEPIGNPLTFFRAHLKNDPGESESLWVLHCLAFDLVAE